MKAIRKKDRGGVMKKLTHKEQLNIIEGLCLLWENGDKKDPQIFVDDIYTTAHLNGNCKNEHLDWHKRGHKLGRALKKFGITNYKTGE